MAFTKKELVLNPLVFYEKYQGARSEDTHIPEFMGLYMKMKTFLEQTDEAIAAKYALPLLPTPLKLQKKMLEQELFFVKDLGYATVLRFCSEFAEFIELLVRTRRQNINKSEGAYPDYFHRKRYYYYLEWCISRFPQVILFPTFEIVGATDLIKLRTVPVFLIGMLENTTYADEFELTPVEFFFHDVNHSRIMVQQDEAYAARKGISLPELIRLQKSHIDRFYGEFMRAQEKPMAALMKMILFEVVHEDGFPFMPDIICERLKRDEGIDLVERMEDGVIKQIEKTTPSTLAFVQYKLLCGFYDKEGLPEAIIVPMGVRTAKNIADATYKILDYFGCVADTNSKEQLMEYAKKGLLIKSIHKCMPDANSLAEEAEEENNATTVVLGTVHENASSSQNSQLSIGSLGGRRPRKTRKGKKGKRLLTKSKRRK